jgi:RNA polymerase sigma factor (sigma-70 family)
VTTDGSSPIDGSMADSDEGRELIESLYEQFGTDLLRFVTALTRNHEQAQEIVQIVFGRTIEKYESITTNVRGWLFQVAHREVALLKRKRAREKEVLAQAVWTITAQKAGNVGNAQQGLEQKEQNERVRQAIERLTDDQKLIVRKKIYDDKTFAVISEELGIPLGTALTRMRTAMQRLQSLLSDD